MPCWWPCTLSSLINRSNTVRGWICLKTWTSWDYNHSYSGIISFLYLSTVQQILSF